MSLTERQRSRMRSVLDALLQADGVVALVADERARTGETDADPALDRAAALLQELMTVIEPLAGGAARRESRPRRR